MKRDLNILTRILLDIEARHVTPGKHFEPKVEGIDKATLEYHLKLLADSECIELQVSKSGSETNYYVLRMKNNGYDFLEENRNRQPIFFF